MFEKASKFAFFQHFLKKTQFSREMHPLKMTLQMEFSNCFLKFFWEHGKPNPSFQVAKIVSFCVFSGLFQVSRTPCQEIKKSRMPKKILAQITYIGRMSRQKSNLEKERYERSTLTYTSCRRKKDKKIQISDFVMTSSAVILIFSTALPLI